MENLADIVSDGLDCRQIAPLAVQDEYGLFGRGWNAGKTAGHKEQSSLNEGAQLDESA